MFLLLNVVELNLIEKKVDILDEMFSEEYQYLFVVEQEKVNIMFLKMELKQKKNNKSFLKNKKTKYYQNQKHKDHFDHKVLF